MRGNFVFTGCYRPGSSASVELGGGGIYCLAGVENRYQSNKGRWASDKTNQFLGQLCFAVCERQNHFVWHYSTVDVCPAANAALSWIIGVSVLLAMIGTFGNVCWALAGHLFQRLFRQYGRPLNIVLALLLVYCAVRIFY